MRLNWLNRRFGTDFVAIGIVAVCVGVFLVVFHDFWFLATGEPPAIWLYDKVLSYLAAAVAAVFLTASFFIFRPGLPKYIAVILTISSASYVVQPLLPVHGYRQIAVLCVARTVAFCTLLLLMRRYRLDMKAATGQRPSSIH
jgi:CBS domain containing-hemolysin-like protein